MSSSTVKAFLVGPCGHRRGRRDIPAPQRFASHVAVFRNRVQARITLPERERHCRSGHYRTRTTGLFGRLLQNGHAVCVPSGDRVAGYARKVWVRCQRRHYECRGHRPVRCRRDPGRCGLRRCHSRPGCVTGWETNVRMPAPVEDLRRPAPEGGKDQPWSDDRPNSCVPLCSAVHRCLSFRQHWRRPDVQDAW